MAKIQYDIIPKEEYDERVKSLMSQLRGKSLITGYQRQEMFILYNDKFFPKRKNSSCPACVEKVYAVMRKYYSDLPS